MEKAPYDTEFGGKLAKDYDVEEAELKKLLADVPVFNLPALKEKIKERPQRTAAGDRKLYAAIAAYWANELTKTTTSAEIRYLANCIVELSREKPSKGSEKVDNLEELLLETKKDVDGINKILGTKGIGEKVKDFEKKWRLLTDLVFDGKVGKDIEETVKKYITENMQPVFMGLEEIRDALQTCAKRKDITEIKEELTKKSAQIGEAFNRFEKLKDETDSAIVEMKKTLKSESDELHGSLKKLATSESEVKQLKDTIQEILVGENKLENMYKELKETSAKMASMPSAEQTAVQPDLADIESKIKSLQDDISSIVPTKEKVDKLEKSLEKTIMVVENLYTAVKQIKEKS